MFIVARFTTVGTWKQPKCPSIEERIKKMRFIYTTEYYPAIKQNKIVPSADVDGHRDKSYRVRSVRKRKKKPV